MLINTAAPFAKEGEATTENIQLKSLASLVGRRVFRNIEHRVSKLVRILSLVNTLTFTIM